MLTYVSVLISHLQSLVRDEEGVSAVEYGLILGLIAEVIVAAKRGLDPSKPVHLFGAGHPMVFPLAAWLGCDLFDSSSYAKFAKDGTKPQNTAGKDFVDTGVTLITDQPASGVESKDSAWGLQNCWG